MVSRADGRAGGRLCTGEGVRFPRALALKGWLVGREGGTRGTPLSFRFLVFVFLKFFFLRELRGTADRAYRRVGSQPRQTCFEHGPRLFIRLVCRRTFPSPRGPRTPSLPFLPSTALDLYLSSSVSLCLSNYLSPSSSVCVHPDNIEPGQAAQP